MMTPSARYFNHFLAAPALLGLALPLFGQTAPAPAVSAAPQLAAETIIERALRRNRANEAADHESRFRFELFTVSEKLAKDGSVEEKKTKRYRVAPMEGASFQRLVEEDGAPLSERKTREEDRRQEEFLEKLRRGEKPDQETNRERVAFDENLTAKYDFTALGIEPLGGRPSYVLGYRPKSGDLPVRTRMDRALNKAEGRIWFDAETFEVAKVEFELKEKVNLWWGLIGSISQLEGQVLRKPVRDGVWFPAAVEITLDGRIFFSSLHRRETLSFGGYERVEAEGGPAPAAPGGGSP